MEALMSNLASKKMSSMILHRVGWGEYILILENEYAKAAHKFNSLNYNSMSEFPLEYVWTFTSSKINLIMRDVHENLVTLSNFKYIENLKKFCYFGVTNLLFNDNHNVLIRNGLAIVVQILLNNNITDEQMRELNELYIKILKENE